MSYDPYYGDVSADTHEQVYDDRDDPDPGPEGTVDIEFSEMCCDHL